MHRRWHPGTTGLRLLVAVVAACGWGSVVAERPDVLLILVDDLKPALGCYGDAAARTPHLDRFAARSLRFDLAYCNQAVCAPSRFCLMLGSHSTSTGLFTLGSRLRDAWPDAVTLPQHFAGHGYRTESLGKVFHVGHGNRGDPESFSVPHFPEKVIEYASRHRDRGDPPTREEALFENLPLDDIRALPRGPACEAADVPDDAYADGRVAAETIRRLQAAAERRRRSARPRPRPPAAAPQTRPVFVKFE